MDVATIITSVQKTHRCVTVEEGWAQHGVGAEIIAVLNERKRVGVAVVNCSRCFRFFGCSS